MNTFRFKSWVLVRIRGCGPYTGSAWRIAAHVYRERAINCMDAIRMMQEDIYALQAAYAETFNTREDLYQELRVAVAWIEELSQRGINPDMPTPTEILPQLRATLAKATSPAE